MSSSSASSGRRPRRRWSASPRRARRRSARRTATRSTSARDSAAPSCSGHHTVTRAKGSPSARLSRRTRRTVPGAEHGAHPGGGRARSGSRGCAARTDARLGRAGSRSCPSRPERLAQRVGGARTSRSPGASRRGPRPQRLEGPADGDPAGARSRADSSASLGSSRPAANSPASMRLRSSSAISGSGSASGRSCPLCRHLSPTDLDRSPCLRTQDSHVVLPSGRPLVMYLSALLQPIRIRRDAHGRRRQHPDRADRRRLRPPRRARAPSAASASAGR